MVDLVMVAVAAAARAVVVLVATRLEIPLSLFSPRNKMLPPLTYSAFDDRTHHRVALKFLDPVIQDHLKISISKVCVPRVINFMVKYTDQP